MQLVAYILVYPLIWVVSILPFRIFYFVSDCIFFLLYYVIGYRKKVVRNNIQIAFPEKSENEIIAIEKKFYHHMVDLFMEMMKSLSMSKKQMTKRFTYTNLEVLHHYGKKKQNVSLVCGHYASWEWMMSLGYFIEHKGYGIYMPIANKYFDRLVRKIRMKHEAYLIPVKEASKTVVKHHKDGELSMYGFAMDQSPMPHRAKYWRKFFGVTVPVFVGAEELAKACDHAVIFLDIQKVKRGYYQTTFKVITDTPNEYENYQITDTFTEMLEEQIRKAPEYYLWTHRRWKHRDKVPTEVLETQTAH
ncbi:lysophospholipid acyltransferase family protein [Sungkyunkwania multivorans]|uniref:Lysophospholipid acyltransferase family protein n=1 Tax=Sungkyunkwania multivorans TaxID=1173618 RepID=A0ABW3CXP3_9FLAO